jgi:hypothetical protein
MAQDPRKQQDTDAERVPDGGTGKLDVDPDRLNEAEQPEVATDDDDLELDDEDDDLEEDVTEE